MKKLTVKFGFHHYQNLISSTKNTKCSVQHVSILSLQLYAFKPFLRENSLCIKVKIETKHNIVCSVKLFLQ